jgi:hypothetical protein
MAVDPELDLSALPRIASRRGAADVLRVARRRQQARKVTAGVGLLAAVALIVGGVRQIETVRPRGAGEGEVTLVLRAVLDDPASPTRLSPGDAVPRGAGIVLQVVTSVPGTLSVEERAREPIWTGPVEVGSHLVGGQSPVAWVPEEQGPVELVARLCPSQGSCVEAVLPLVIR